MWRMRTSVDVNWPKQQKRGPACSSYAFFCARVGGTLQCCTFLFRGEPRSAWLLTCSPDLDSGAAKSLPRGWEGARQSSALRCADASLPPRRPGASGHRADTTVPGTGFCPYPWGGPYPGSCSLLMLLFFQEWWWDFAYVLILWKSSRSIGIGSSLTFLKN